MHDETFVAYFIANGRSAGQCAMRMPDDGHYPVEVEWEGNLYKLIDGDPVDREAHYGRSGR